MQQPSHSRAKLTDCQAWLIATHFPPSFSASFLLWSACYSLVVILRHEPDWHFLVCYWPTRYSFRSALDSEVYSPDCCSWSLCADFAFPFCLPLFWGCSRLDSPQISPFKSANVFLGEHWWKSWKWKLLCDSFGGQPEFCLEYRLALRRQLGATTDFCYHKLP